MFESHTLYKIIPPSKSGKEKSSTTGYRGCKAQETLNKHIESHVDFAKTIPSRQRGQQNFVTEWNRSSLLATKSCSSKAHVSFKAYCNHTLLNGSSSVALILLGVAVKGRRDGVVDSVSA
jgi:hypothetical protein